MKLAKGATGRNDVITMNKAYHGHEGFSLSANGKDYYKELFLPLMPGFHMVDFNDLEAVRRLAGKNIAAIVLEPVQGEGGIHVATRDYMKGLRQICDEHGIMLIFDEVQTGFGRTGTLWAMEHYGVIPDIMFTAKSISGGALSQRSGGLPGNRTARPAMWRPTRSSIPPMAGARTWAASSRPQCWTILWRTRLWENAATVGKRFKEGLSEIWRDNEDCVKEVRGLGLMIGIEYKYEFIGALMADCLAKQGVWAVYSGNAPQVMRFQIPITASHGGG
ncbi:MAG: aminotransferase class III-fold pyridoxal phosphate-dependent enzyme [Desulfosudis oleivorans]|nr:aminotransferase class III-fold pyridoxal phosphate-dependent enzyme [Desulfosudis oleivorans]